MKIFCITWYSFPKINEKNESLVWSHFESDKVNCYHLLPTVMHALNSFFKQNSILLLKSNSITIKSHWFGFDVNVNFIFGKEYSSGQFIKSNLCCSCTRLFSKWNFLAGEYEAILAI